MNFKNNINFICINRLNVNKTTDTSQVSDFLDSFNLQFLTPTGHFIQLNLHFSSNVQRSQMNFRYKYVFFQLR